MPDRETGELPSDAPEDAQICPPPPDQSISSFYFARQEDKAPPCPPKPEGEELSFAQTEGFKKWLKKIKEKFSGDDSGKKKSKPCWCMTPKPEEDTEETSEFAR